MLAELLPPALDAHLQSIAGLTHLEFQVLSMLLTADEYTRQAKELAAATASTAPRLSPVVSKLERRGLVSRETDASDRRAVNLTLTAEGRRVVIRATGSHIANIRRLILSQLDDDEMQSLASIGRKLTQSLDPNDRMGYDRATDPSLKSRFGAP